MMVVTPSVWELILFFGSVEILSYPKFGITLGTVMSVTPSRPKEGEATQGETPLTSHPIQNFSSAFDET